MTTDGHRPSDAPVPTPGRRSVSEPGTVTVTVTFAGTYRSRQAVVEVRGPLPTALLGAVTAPADPGPPEVIVGTGPTDGAPGSPDSLRLTGRATVPPDLVGPLADQLTRPRRRLPPRTPRTPRTHCTAQPRPALWRPSPPHLCNATSSPMLSSTPTTTWNSSPGAGTARWTPIASPRPGSPSSTGRPCCAPRSSGTRTPKSPCTATLPQRSYGTRTERSPAAPP